MNPTDNRANNRERNRSRSAADQQIPARMPPAGRSVQGTPTQRFAPRPPSSVPAGRDRVTDGGQSARTQYGAPAAYGDQRAPQQPWLAPPPPSARPAPPLQPAAAPDKGDEKLSFIERLMLRGARGELIQQPWFQSIRRDNADMFVYASFGAALLIVMALQFAVSSITMTGVVFMVLVRYPVWLALGYAYIALGTKLAHRFLLGTCVVGVVVAVLGVFAALSAMSMAHNVNQLLGVDAVPMGLLIFVLLVTAVAGALYGYLGLMVYRGIKRLHG